MQKPAFTAAAAICVATGISTPHVTKLWQRINSIIPILPFGGCGMILLFPRNKDSDMENDLSRIAGYQQKLKRLQKQQRSYVAACEFEQPIKSIIIICSVVTTDPLFLSPADQPANSNTRKPS